LPVADSGSQRLEEAAFPSAQRESGGPAHRLRAGAKVEYTMTLHDGKTRAKNVRVID
jgi:hypothetical protein